MKFQWTERYSVHVHLLDEQHQHYFEILNRIVDRLDPPDFDREEIRLLLSELFDYAAYHLETEEKYFAELNYPEAKPHIALHNYYRQTVAELMKQIDNPGQDMAAFFSKVVEFASEWFASHILVEDQKYSQFFNEHGVK